MGDTGTFSQVELEVGKKYCFKSELGDMPFVVEAGGVIQGDGITGSVQSGRVIFTAKGKEVEGNFIKSTVISANWTDGKQSGQIQITSGYLTLPFLFFFFQITV